MPLTWRGDNYLVHMCTDLAFLPVPVVADPLLIDWFGRHLGWMVASLPHLQELERANEILSLAATVDSATPDATSAQEIAERCQLVRRTQAPARLARSLGCGGWGAAG